MRRNRGADFSLRFLFVEIQTEVSATKQANGSIKQLTVARGALLHGLAPTRCQFARRQSTQRLGVNQYKFWLMKGADQILARRQIHRGLAADRSINLREQRGGYLNEGHAAQVRSRRETREIADHASAERDDRVGPFEAGLAEESQRPLKRAQRLEALAVFHQPGSRYETGAAQTLIHLLSKKIENGSV